MQVVLVAFNSASISQNSSKAELIKSSDQEQLPGMLPQETSDSNAIGFLFLFQSEKSALLEAVEVFLAL